MQHRAGVGRSMCSLAARMPGAQQAVPDSSTLHCCRFRGPLGGRLLQRRGSLILRKLSLLLGPQKVFCALADILNQEQDLRFASAMVQALNVILLTAPEVTYAQLYSTTVCETAV